MESIEECIGHDQEDEESRRVVRKQRRVISPISGILQAHVMASRQDLHARFELYL